jgi:hypothetical protein
MMSINAENIVAKLVELVETPLADHSHEPRRLGLKEALENAEKLPYLSNEMNVETLSARLFHRSTVAEDPFFHFPLEAETLLENVRMTAGEAVHVRQIDNTFVFMVSCYSDKGARFMETIKAAADVCGLPSVRFDVHIRIPQKHRE